MARTKNSKPDTSATKSKGAAGRSAKTEGTRLGPVETPGARIKLRKKSANPPESTSKNKNKSEAKSMPSANDKTEIESKANFRSTAPKGSGSGQPEPRSRPSEIKPVAAKSQEQEGQKLATNGHLAAEESTIALAELEFHDLPDLLTSPLEPSAKVARSEKEEAIFRKLEQALGAFTSARQLGQVSGDAQFDWSETNGLDLRPDLAFVSFERWAQHRDVPKSQVWHVIPDLVVEIIRNSVQTEKLSDWLEAYFRSGVNRVWIVYPEQLKIHDHDSLSASRVLGRDDTIDGRTMLPGFQLPVKELLAE